MPHLVKGKYINALISYKLIFKAIDTFDKDKKKRAVIL